MARMIHRKLAPSLIALLALSLPTTLISLVQGDQSAAESPQVAAPADLIEQIRAAEDRFQPIGQTQVDAAQAELDRNLTRLGQQLSRGSAENTERWREYLRWTELREQVASETPDLSILEEIYLKFRGSEAGMDLPRFVAARKSLREFNNTLFFARNEQYQQQFGVQLKTLADTLENYRANPLPGDAAVLGGVLGWFEQGNQMSDLTQAVRAEVDHPNLYVQVSADFLAQGLARQVDEVAPIHDVILGTQIHGEGRTQGQIDAKVIPHPSRGVIEFGLTGHNLSQNVGQNGPLTIYSTGNTSIASGKRIEIGAEGIFGLPPWAHAQTHTTFTGFGAKHNLVRKIGSKQAYKKKAQAEAIASLRAAERVKERLNKEVSAQLVDANKRFNEQLLLPLKGRDGMPQVLDFRTTPRGIDFTMLQASLTQLSAPGPPPAPAEQGGAFSVQLHQSLVSNLGELLLGGVTLTDERLVELLQEADAEIPEELKITPDSDPWSITFDYYRPIEANFNAGQIELSMRGRQFTRGDSVVNRTIRISAKYQVSRGEQGLTLVRDGDVVVDFVRQDRLGALDLTAKTFLTRKFDAVFKQEIVGEGIELEGEFAKLGKLTVSSLDISPGWFVAAWSVAGEASGDATSAE
ncbi:MAG: hypothetical protein WDZ51_14235 [Pirellulaceae bacterium]